MALVLILTAGGVRPVGATSVLRPSQVVPRLTKASFKDKVIAEWWNTEAIKQFRFGIEIELHAPTLSREALAEELVKIYRGKYDPESAAIVGTKIGTIEFRKETAGHEFVTAPLTYDQLVEFAQGLDELGRVPGVEGTTSENKVGMHVNVSLPPGRLGALFAARMGVSSYGNYDAIVADDPIPAQRTEFAKNVNEATFVYLASELSASSHQSSKTLEELRRTYRELEHGRYRAANLDPKNGVRIEYRYPNTKLGSTKNPRQGSEHVIREVRFVGSLALSALQGVIDAEGKLVAQNKLHEAYSRLPKWMQDKQAINVSLLTPFGLVLNRQWGWKRAIDRTTGALSSWAVRNVHEIPGIRFLGAEMTGKTQGEGNEDIAGAKTGWNVLLQPDYVQVVRRSRGTFVVSNDPPGILEKSGDHTTLLQQDSGEVLLEDFIGAKKVGSDLYAVEGKHESFLMDGALWRPFHRGPGKFFPAKYGGIIHQKGKEKKLLSLDGELLLEGFLDETKVADGLVIARGSGEKVAYWQKSGEVVARGDATLSVSVKDGVVRENRGGRSRILRILAGHHWAKVTEEVAALPADEIIRFGGRNGSLLAVQGAGSGALLSLKWRSGDLGTVMNRDFASYHLDDATGLFVGTNATGANRSEQKALFDGAGNLLVDNGFVRVEPVPSRHPTVKDSGVSLVHLESGEKRYLLKDRKQFIPYRQNVHFLGEPNEYQTALVPTHYWQDAKEPGGTAALFSIDSETAIANGFSSYDVDHGWLVGKMGERKAILQPNTGEVLVDDVERIESPAGVARIGESALVHRRSGQSMVVTHLHRNRFRARPVDYVSYKVWDDLATDAKDALMETKSGTFHAINDQGEEDKPSDVFSLLGTEFSRFKLWKREQGLVLVDRTVDEIVFPYHANEITIDAKNPKLFHFSRAPRRWSAELGVRGKWDHSAKTVGHGSGRVR